ncbi:MAG: hypothetical protein PHD56_11220 [Anaerostipes sp.]|nr:hypothetical protein [Anaerostipes sp.]
MSYKKIDKDQLIEGLTEYLSNQYMDHVQKKESLIQKKYELEEEKQKILLSSNSSDLIRMKKIFSPITIDGDIQKDESKESKKLTSDIHKIQSKIRDLEKDLNKIKSYIQGLKETYFIADDVKQTEDKVKFLPAVYELLDHIKAYHEDVSIDYTLVGEDTEVLLTFSYLNGFQNMLRFLFNELLVSTLKVDFFVEKSKVLMQFITELEVFDSLESFKLQKSELESQLSKEFSIIRWQESSIILQAIVE